MAGGVGTEYARAFVSALSLHPRKKKSRWEGIGEEGGG